MKQVKTQKKDSSNNRIVEKLRKSQVVASNEFELKKLCRRQEGFLNCSLEEEKESLTLTYEVKNLTSYLEIKKEKKELILSSLIDVGKLYELAGYYSFSIAPSNLYYDIQGRVYVKLRDIYASDDGFSEEEFLEQYKALIGCTLSKKYKFEDYNDGGLDLLKEDKFLNVISECKDVEEIIEKLHEEYDRYTEVHKQKFIEVSRAKNKNQKAALGILGFLLVMCGVFLGYLLIWERPYEQAVISANEAYLQSNYSGTVDAMADVAIDRMNTYQKYILAVSCVKCESLSDKNMNNILNTISLNGDEKVMEYWIHINRMNTDAAADIAMQQSSNQLLYYAYLKEKAIIENDSTLTGQEKSERLAEIESKLKPLEDEYSKLTEE